MYVSVPVLGIVFLSGKTKECSARYLEDWVSVPILGIIFLSQPSPKTFQDIERFEFPSPCWGLFFISIIELHSIKFESTQRGSVPVLGIIFYPYPL